MRNLVQLRLRDLLLIVAVIAGGCLLARTSMAGLVLYATVAAPLIVRWLPNSLLRAVASALTSWGIATVAIFAVFQALTQPEASVVWREDLVEAMGKGLGPGALSALGSLVVDGVVFLGRRNNV